MNSWKMCVGVLAGAAAAVVASPGPADAAQDDYVVIAAGQVNGSPPVKTAAGRSIGPDAAAANGAALSDCVRNGGHQCVVVVSAKNACAAVASNDVGEYEGASDPSLQVAIDNANRSLQSKQGAHIVTYGCVILPAPPSSPPVKPPTPLAQGPTLRWNPVVGGLEAHITDRSGVASRCTYETDDYSRGFALPANSTYDLRIVPAVPRFTNWNVTVACDNGTKTEATTFF